jgi:iron complex outermembrane receptor protein
MKNVARPNHVSMSVDQFVKQSVRAPWPRSGLARGAVTVGLAIGLGSNPTLAADAGSSAVHEQSQLLEEIVVTAQFREQSAQSTPVAITAVTGADIDERSMSNLADLNTLAPNLNITAGTNTNGPSAQTFIRGIGQSDGHPGLDPGVGIYVDDVYHGLLLGSDLDLTDLDRVEVLRGPQGTLAGKNSIGGSIKLFSRKPRDETDGYAEASYGDFNRVNVRAGANFTLIPNRLFVRVSGTSKHADGYMTRLDYGCVNQAASGVSQVAVLPNCKLGTEGGQDVHAARVALRLIAGESVENNLIASVTADRSEVPALKLLFSANTQTLPNGQPFIPGGGSQFITGPTAYTTYATYMNLGFTDPARYAGQRGAGTHSALSVPTTDPIDFYGVTDTLTWKLAEHYSLTAITGYLRYKGQYSIEVGDSPLAAQLLNDTWSQRQFTEELRLNGTSFDKLDWTAGLYYYDQKAYFGGLKLLSPGLASETLFTGNDPIPSKNKSAFLHAVYRLTNELSVIAGVRYTKEQKDYTFQRLNPYAPQFASYTPVGPLNNTTGTYSGNHTDYRAGLQYQWTDNIMTYAQYSTGFRGGGVNPRPFVVQQEVPFKPETLRAAELGIKSDLFDRRLRVNLAGFYNQYKDILFTDSTPTVVNGVTISANNATPVNVGEAHIYGAEAEVEVHPFSGLQIDASAGYLKFKLTSINQVAARIQGVTLDTQEPYAPDRMANVGIQYSIPMGAAGSLVPRFDAQYQSSFFTDITNTALGHVAGRTLMNARLAWKSANDDWETAFTVLNAGDKFYYINKVNAPNPTFITQGQPGAPRQWMVTLRRNF